jgi:aryl-alcohol dehydrogenase-like predicted oxidoreductase
MRYIELPGASRPASACVLGTSGTRDESGFAVLDEFVAAGGNCLDTARVYGGGASERTVGDWIRRRGSEGLVVIGKGAHPPDCRPEAVERELSESLDRLGLERIDIYLLHRDNPDVPVGEFVDALEAPLRAGLIGAYGGSNWSRERMVAANQYARDRGAIGMTVLSNHFSLADPVEPLYPGCAAVSATDRRFLESTGIALVPWSSQARGFFAETSADRLDPNMWRCWDTVANRSRRDRAARLAERLGLRTINIALAYVLNQRFTVLPIIGPQNVSELRIALRGADTALDAAQLRWLESGGAMPN